MSKVVIVIRFELPAGDLRHFEPMMGAFRDESSEASGFLGTNVWRHIDNDRKFMRLVYFRDMEAATRSYDGMVKSGFLAESVETFGVLPDVHRYHMVWTHGKDGLSATPDELISLSERNFDPGFGQEWVVKLGENLSELQALPGYLGASIGKRDILEDQILGLASWANEAAFRKSVPRRPEYSIELYKHFR